MDREEKAQTARPAHTLRAMWALARYRPWLYLLNFGLWSAFYVVPLVVGLLTAWFFDTISGSVQTGWNVWTLVGLIAGVGLSRVVILYAALVSWSDFWNSVEALLRRSRIGAAESTGPTLAAVFTLGAAAVDRRKFCATVGGQTVALTARELKLAEVFANHPGEVLTRDALLNAVWGVDYFGTTRTLDQHVAQLRKKIEGDGDAAPAIVTVHGVGYRYDA